MKSEGEKEMTETTYSCDLCGKEIGKQNVYTNWGRTFFKGKYGSLYVELHYEGNTQNHPETCNSCGKAIQEFFKQWCE